MVYRSFIPIVFLVFGLTIQAIGSIYIVEPSGANGNPGSESLPLLTIQYSIDRMF